MYWTKLPSSARATRSNARAADSENSSAARANTIFVAIDARSERLGIYRDAADVPKAFCCWRKMRGSFPPTQRGARAIMRRSPQLGPIPFPERLMPDRKRTDAPANTEPSFVRWRAAPAANAFPQLKSLLAYGALRQRGSAHIAVKAGGTTFSTGHPRSIHERSRTERYLHTRPWIELPPECGSRTPVSSRLAASGCFAA